MSAMVLSLFPGIGLLDMAFEEVGFCVVRGPDVLRGGDVKRFHPPASRFDGEAARWARGTIVLTVAHLDHTPENRLDANLKAFCRRCHLRYDAKHHAANARRTREVKSPQLRFLGIP